MVKVLHNYLKLVCLVLASDIIIFYFILLMKFLTPPLSVHIYLDDVGIAESVK